MNWWQRLIYRNRLEQQLRAEVLDHLERLMADNLHAGMTRDEARRNALLQFGGLEQIKEECRDARGTLWIEAIVQDLRFACRTFSKNPGFALAAACTLALGIGVNTAIFSIVNGVVLRPLPYYDPGRLVAVDEQLRTTGQNFAFSYPDFLDCKRASHSFQGIAAWRNLGVNVTFPGKPEFVRARQVSAEFLSVLGVRPVLGRNFRSDEDRRNMPPVAIIGYSLWQERFGRSPKAIGATLVIGGRGHTVVGVLPPNFRFYGERQILTPIGQNESVSVQKRDLYPGIKAVARLKPRVTLAQANAELKTIGRQLAQAYPDTNENRTFGAEALKDQVIGDVGRTLFLLAGAVALVLLIACANVANLFLAKALSRTQEFAIRAALGASRGRLIRQMLTESALLSLLGGAVGLVTAASMTKWALRRMPDWLPRTDEVALDVHVLLFALVASLLTGVAFGLAPAMRMGALLDRLSRGSRGTAYGLQRLQSGFVAAELALTLVLLTGAGLMIRTLACLWAVDPGFDMQRLMVMSIGLSPKVAGNPALMRTAWQQTLERVRNTPGVQAAAFDSLVPLSGDSQALAYWTSSEPAPPKNAPQAFAYTPTPDYLRTMKIPLLQGRFFTPQDRVGSNRVVVIDDRLAKLLFSGKDPVGREFTIQLMGRVRVIGVVKAVKHQSLDEDAYGPSEPALYIPFLQFPDEFMPLTQNGMSLLVRTATEPKSVIPALRESILGPDRDQPVRDVVTMDELARSSMRKRRGMLILLSAFAGIALLLAAVGIYGVVSYSMSRRTQEIGIRMALGAQPAQVLSLILGQGARMLLAGMGLGLMASIVLARLMASFLFGISPTDPATFAAVGATLCLVATAAIYIPARRATRVDPLAALRYE